jgi:hypothetical protein
MPDPRDQWDLYVERANSVLQGLINDAQETLASGKRSLDEYQSRRETERLLIQLGAAVYAQQRAGGTDESVLTAMAAVDAHVAQYGWLGMPADAVVPPPEATPPTG